MQITSTTLRRIIKEELDAVMSENRVTVDRDYEAERQTSIDAKRRASVERRKKEKEGEDQRRGSYYRHQPPDRPETYPGEFAARYMQEEGVLDDIVGRKPSGAPMTAQARQDVLDGYMRAIADMQNVIPGLSREEAVENLIDLATAGGDPYVDPQSEMFDEDLVRSLLSGE